MGERERDAFGIQLKHFRLGAGLTQEGLAERAGISARAVSDLERGGGRAPRLETVGLLAAGLALTEAQRATLLTAARPALVAVPAIGALVSPIPRLPVPPNPLIGREHAVRELTALLCREDVRLVTLTGPGGVGKTRVALAVADAITGAFPDGVIFIPLAAIVDPLLVSPTIAATLGIRAGADETDLQALQVALRDRELLLVLDNCEQVLGAAPAVADLLAACPGLTVLATSRSVLRLRGEREVAVPPLGLPGPHQTPDLASLSDYGAIRLFIERTREISCDFVLTAENASTVVTICRRLDGLPLALELAAARLRLFTPQTLLARLDQRLTMLTGGARDLPARQRTLRDTIAWSYEMLSAEERTLFASLAVFIGGWTLGAMEVICDRDGNSGIGPLDHLDSLVAQSLVRRDEGTGSEPRFGMLETIREFARERLAESGAVEALHERHATYFLARVEEAAPHVIGPDQQAWVPRLDAERDNLRAALGWAGDRGDGESLARFVGALCFYWSLRGHYLDAEVIRWAEAALAMELSPGARAAVLFVAGQHLWYCGESDRAYARGEECLALSHTLGDRRGEANALTVLGLAASDRGRFVAARSFHERALTIARERGDQFTVAMTLNHLGAQASQERDFDRARSRCTESVAVARTLGNQALICVALHNLGWAAMEQGDEAAAFGSYSEGLALNGEDGDVVPRAMLLANLGELLRRRGDSRDARDRLGAALAILGEVRDPRITERVRDGLARLALAAGDTDEARAHADEALRLRRAIGDPARVADGLALLARVAARQGRLDAARIYVQEGLTIAAQAHAPHAVVACLDASAERASLQGDAIRAACLWASIATRRAELRLGQSRADDARRAQLIGEARAQLDARTWEAAWAAGARMTEEEAIAWAMDGVKR